MTAQKLDGKATAAAIKSELAERVAALRDQGVVPGLGTRLRTSRSRANIATARK